MNYLNFSWIIDNKLAGHAGPKSVADIIWLKDQGITACIRMAEPHSAFVSSTEVVEAGISDYHVPVKDFTAPTPVQLKSMVDIIDKCLAQGKSISVSCVGGFGRTGTVLSSYLVFTGMGAKEAIKLIRQKRPGSVETEAQEEAVTKFMDDIEIQKKWPKTVDEAVDRILLMISEEDKNTIKNCQSKDDMSVYHASLGTWIRNNFGLWRDNKQLIQSCGGHTHPDDNSAVILLALWDKLHKQSTKTKA